MSGSVSIIPGFGFRVQTLNATSAKIEEFVIADLSEDEFTFVERVPADGASFSRKFGRG